MSPFLRKVKTASGATAVQIVAKQGRTNRIIEHLGSAHDEAELAALMAVGREKLAAPGQDMLDFGVTAVTQPAMVTGSISTLLVEVGQAAWSALGFDQIRDEAFFQLVLARLVEPTSMLDSTRVLGDLGIDPVHRSTMKRCLRRIAGRGYRDQLARSFAGSPATTPAVAIPGAATCPQTLTRPAGPLRWQSQRNQPPPCPRSGVKARLQGRGLGVALHRVRAGDDQQPDGDEKEESREKGARTGKKGLVGHDWALNGSADVDPPVVGQRLPLTGVPCPGVAPSSSRDPLLTRTIPLL